MNSRKEITLASESLYGDEYESLFLKFLGNTFSGRLNAGWQKIKEAPRLMQLSMIVLAAICIISGLLLLPPFKPFLESATNVLLLGREYQEAVFANIR